MQNLLEWAAKWHIPRAAMDDLLVTGYSPVAGDAEDGASESRLQSEVRLEAPRKGMILFRNNVGVLMDDRGVPVRYGLCNESKRVNQTWKSGDLIGIRPVVIKPEMVGYKIGQFVSYECKAPNWKFKGNEHEKAQLNWQRLVTEHGGHAQFINHKAQLI